jgi:Tfp pilus assembly protein PilO
MNALKSERFWLVGGTLAAVLVAAVAWFGAVGPELSNASSLEAQTVDAQTQNISTQAKIRKLRQDNADMPKLVTALLQARTALPIGTDIATYTQRLSDYAAKNHVVVTGINASAPVSATARAGQPTTPVAGSVAGKLYALPLTVIVKGAIPNDLQYLKAVQSDSRAALVTSTQLANDASKSGNSLTQLTIQLEVFVAPQTPEMTKALLAQLAATSSK